MKKEYDFSKGKRGATLDPKKTKVQTSLRIDGDVQLWARSEAAQLGVPYQTFLNMKLREAMIGSSNLEQRLAAVEKALKIKAG